MKAIHLSAFLSIPPTLQTATVLMSTVRQITFLADWTGLGKRGLVKRGLVKHRLVKGGLVKRGLAKNLY